MLSSRPPKIVERLPAGAHFFSSFFFGRAKKNDPGAGREALRRFPIPAKKFDCFTPKFGGSQ